MTGDRSACGEGTQGFQARAQHSRESSSSGGNESGASGVGTSAVAGRRAEEARGAAVDVDGRTDGRKGFDAGVMLGTGMVVLVGAVAVGVQQLLRAVLASKSSVREGRAQQAIVARALPSIVRRDAAVAGKRMKFVVSENFNADATESKKASQPWRSLLSNLDQESPLTDQFAAPNTEFSGWTQTQEPGLSVVDGQPPFLRNPAAPGSICGGSATGGAVAVSASLSDIALATDTLGNLRVPAACCGVIGIRATSGCLDSRGVVMLSHSLDAMGFMVKDPALLTRVGDLMRFPGKKDWRGDVIKIYLARDLFSQWVGNEGFNMYAAVAKACLNWAGPEMVEEFDLSQFLSGNAGRWKELAGEGGDVYEGLRQAALCIGRYEFAQSHSGQNGSTSDKEGKEEDNRIFGCSAANPIGKDLYEKALDVRDNIQGAFKAGIRENKLVVTPLLLRPPIPRSSSEDEFHKFEKESQQMCALASLVGCPQICFPIRNASNQLYSVAIMSLNKSDRVLLAITEKLIDLVGKTKLEAEGALTGNKAKKVNKVNSHPKDDRESEAERFRDLGNRLYREQKFEEAILAYTKAINKFPKAVYYSNRAQAYLNLIDFESAEADCNSALALDSVNAKAILRRGFARVGMNKLQEAKRDFQQVLAIEPKNSQARSELKLVTEKIRGRV